MKKLITAWLSLGFALFVGAAAFAGPNVVQVWQRPAVLDIPALTVSTTGIGCLRTVTGTIQAVRCAVQTPVTGTGSATISMTIAGVQQSGTLVITSDTAVANAVLVLPVSNTAVTGNQVLCLRNTTTLGTGVVNCDAEIRWR